MAEARLINFRNGFQNRVIQSAQQSQINRDAREEMSPEQGEHQRDLQRQRRVFSARDKYLENIKKDPTEISISCGGTWFAFQVKLLNKINVSAKFHLSNKFPSLSEDYLFSSICRRHISSGQIPSLCLSEGFNIPEIPDCLKDLTCLEERLISPRIPFMRIISLGYEWQCAVRGAVVNVPILFRKL